MDISVFEYRDYKRFLRDLLKKNPRFQQGGRIRFSKAMGCQPGYVTQVLNADADLSLEQGEALSREIGMDRRELSYFLLLVTYARAGTPSLKSHYLSQIDAQSSERLNLKDKAKPGEILSAADQAIYYSSWHYAVVHMLCTIPSFEFREQMATRLGLAAERVGEILSYLESAGLITRENGKLKTTSKRVFIDKDSLFNYRHHANFRQLSMVKLDQLQRHDFHYSGVHTLSREDRAKVVELIRDLILKSREIIKGSPEEEIFGFNIDFFKI